MKKRDMICPLGLRSTAFSQPVVMEDLIILAHPEHIH